MFALRRKTLVHVSMLAAAGISLAACVTDAEKVRSLDGAAAAFDAPPYAVKGKTSYDQRWIDGQVEAGVAAFGWPRPAPRPAELDVPRVKAMPVKASPAPPKKKSLLDRLRGR
jgi:hypothetical protein